MFDPSQPLIGPDGLEYENFAARLQGRPLDCRRNHHIRTAKRDDPLFWHTIYTYYRQLTRSGELYAWGACPGVPQYHPDHPHCPPPAGRSAA